MPIAIERVDIKSGPRGPDAFAFHGTVFARTDGESFVFDPAIIERQMPGRDFHSAIRLRTETTGLPRDYTTVPSRSLPTKYAAIAAVTYPNTAKAYVASSKQRMRPSGVRGQYSEPIVVSSIAVHQSAVP